MANQAIKKQGGAKPVGAVTAPGATSASVPEKAPACAKCKDTGRVIFVEQGRGLRSVGPCGCVKA